MTKDIIQKSTKIMKLIVLIGMAAAAITTALTFFAKAKTVQALDQRLWLNTSEDIVRYKESDVRWTEQRIAFQRRDKPPTVAESEIVKKAEEELVEAKNKHNDRVKAFEEEYKQNFEVRK